MKTLAKYFGLAVRP